MILVSGSQVLPKTKWAISSNGLVVHPVTAASATPFDDRTMTPTEPTEPVESRVKKWYSPSLLAQALYRSDALFPHKCISTHFGSNQGLLQMILWIVSSCPCQSMTNLTRYNARKRIFAHFLGNKCKDRLSNHSTKAYPESWGLPIHFGLLGHNTHPRRRRNHCKIGPHDGELDRWLYDAIWLSWMFIPELWYCVGFIWFWLIPICWIVLLQILKLLEALCPHPRNVVREPYCKGCLCRVQVRAPSNHCLVLGDRHQHSWIVLKQLRQRAAPFTTWAMLPYMRYPSSQWLHLKLHVDSKNTKINQNHLSGGSVSLTHTTSELSASTFWILRMTRCDSAMHNILRLQCRVESSTNATQFASLLLQM